MRVLVAGDWHSDLHEEEMSRSLRRLGHEVIEFKWHHYFLASAERSSLTRALSDLYLRAQNKYLAGPILKKINHDLKSAALSAAPDLLFVYRGTHIHRETLVAIKRSLPQCVIAGYNNDDPFSPTQPKYYWRHFIRSIPVYDLMLAYRERNIAEFKTAGAKRVELLRSWFVPDRNYPVALSPKESGQFACDVVFIGHYEPDGRLECMEEIVRRGYKLKLFGPTKYWDGPLRQSTVLGSLAPVRMVWGADYNRALAGAKIALCFLSKLNRDTYTRRCFEIPAVGTLMLSERTADLSQLYIEGIEIDFFSDRSELMEKIEFYLQNEQVRTNVAQAGRMKVVSAGHDIDSRMCVLLGWVHDLATKSERHENRD